MTTDLPTLVAADAPVFQCSWCSRWMMKPSDDLTIYIDPPNDGRPPSHGICPPCKAEVEAKLMAQREKEGAK